MFFRVNGKLVIQEGVLYADPSIDMIIDICAFALGFTSWSLIEGLYNFIILKIVIQITPNTQISIVNQCDCCRKCQEKCSSVRPVETCMNDLSIPSASILKMYKVLVMQDKWT